MLEQLKQLRDQIDVIDDELLQLISKRATLAQEIGKIKKSGIVYRPEREAQILTRIQAHNPGPISNQHIGHFFTEIMSLCRALEKPMSVAYLGPNGTFSEEAALKRFGSAITEIACDSIDDVFRNVESDTASYGVVPVENSSEGAVGRTMDLLLQTPLMICGEIQLPVHQFLMAQHTDLTRITNVSSHPQSLAQCHHWLKANLPHVPTTAFINAASNADAARQAASDSQTAAIASRRAAELYELSICAENIEDDPNNTTRFVVIGKQETLPSGKDKTSLVMATDNRSGAIYQLLEPLAQHGVSMSRLESRPSRTGLWQYVFFVDLEGHQQNEQVAAALSGLRDRAIFLKILGSYPTA
ncbi:prephenate dehydratase [Nitrosomonas sp. JL21]|uniref:prephenate dehydratase n=1 Tax=Nitrosomonas sp. JL21 TaxID=153949 RepID=UPI00136CCFAD|nr:prephenate dehydratase [Nitrosomonas sp. JL21]MBL8498315.1 prephenate dehydratase [Nitrosomonas sp.]MCC7090974.1 prephenate dehydratase [Nitrosomonas sp.]MXS77532.1 prephenate dehydratase [Nitrosomonas sp. JL21]